MIVGITGTIGAGKGTIVEILKKRGFKHYSVREFITAEIKKRGMSVGRESMFNVANELRKNNSPSFIAEQLYEAAKKSGGDAIIESLRAVGEVEALKKKGNFYLIAVDAKPEIRYGRIVKRGSVTDNLSYQEFLSDESKEMSSRDSSKQNISACISMADFTVENNGTIEELGKKVNDILKRIL